MKLIVRADDVGYTDVCNIGTFKTIEEGIVTSADVMLDTPGTIDALRRLRAFPWISIGWHTHFWGSPVLGAEKVPSLFDCKRNGFRKDLRTAEDVKYEEALEECYAEIELCVKTLGRAPDTGMIMGGGTPFTDALKHVADEYGLAQNFITGHIGAVPKEWKARKADPKWADRKIVGACVEYFDRILNQSDSIHQIDENYDPVRYFKEDHGLISTIPEDHIVMTAWHPGYVDYYMYKCGDYSPQAKQYIDIRTVDTHALCSEELKDWIVEKGIELVNFRDALYGTREYQNHLKAIGSRLAV